MAEDEQAMSGSKRASDDGYDQDGANGQPTKRQRMEDFHSEIRILVPNRNTGAIIGKGGENIKRLRADFNASISIPDCQGPERIVNISAQASSLCDLLSEMLKKLERDASSEGSELRMLVHQGLAGRIIGKGGAKVKELREETGAQIKVYTECCPQSTERVVQITGQISEISNCVGGILDVLKDAQVKGPNIPYDANFYDESYVQDYGGFTDGGRFGGGYGGGAPRGGRGGFGGQMGRGGRGGGGYGGGGYGGGPGMGGGPMGGGYGMGGGGGFGGGGFGGGFGGPRGGGGGYGGMGRGGGMMGGGKQTSQQVSIPKSLAGAIIGKGGSRIRQVQMESGTMIKMEEPDVAGEERIITISGAPDQIQYAQYLLQQTVKQHTQAGGF